MPDLLLGRGLCGLRGLVTISDLISLFLLAAVTLVNFLSDYGIRMTTLVSGGFFSAGHTFTVLNKSLRLGR